MVLNVNTQITPYRALNTLSQKLPAKSLRSNQLVTSNKPGISKSKFIFIPAKKQTQNINSLFILTKNKPRSKQPFSVGNIKEIQLYQQIERNKVLSGKAELVNRFNFKA